MSSFEIFEKYKNVSIIRSVLAIHLEMKPSIQIKSPFCMDKKIQVAPNG